MLNIRISTRMVFLQVRRALQIHESTAFHCTNFALSMNELAAAITDSSNAGNNSDSETGNCPIQRQAYRLSAGLFFMIIIPSCIFTPLFHRDIGTFAFATSDPLAYERQTFI